MLGRRIGICLSVIAVAMSGCTATEQMAKPANAPMSIPSSGARDVDVDSTDWVAAGGTMAGHLSIAYVNGDMDLSTTLASVAARFIGDTVTSVSFTLSAALKAGPGFVPWDQTTVSAGGTSTVPAHLLKDTSAVVRKFGRTCGLQLTGHGHLDARLVLKGQSGTPVEHYHEFRDLDASPTSQHNCPNPVATIKLNFGDGPAAAAVSVMVPSGTDAFIGIDGTASASGEEHGPNISGYDWTVNSYNASTSATFGTNFSYSGTVGLTVTDADGGTGSAGGTVSVTFINACDDPLTHGEEEECDEETGGPTGTTVGTGGGTVDPGEYHGGGSESHYICDVTDWFYWNPSTHKWVYDYSEINSCDVYYY